MIAVLQILIIAGLFALPAVVGAIPGRYRVALSERNPLLSELAEGVIDRVAPVATALPAPAQVDSAAEVDFTDLLLNEPTATLAPPKPTATDQS